MLREFTTWWSQQMLDLVRPFVLGAPAWSNATILDVDGADQSFSLVRRDRGAETRLGPLELNDAGIAAIRLSLKHRGGPRNLLMRLPPGRLLEHRYKIPIAAERDAALFLRYEIDRVTPFSPDEVFWNFEIEDRDTARGRLHVRLSMVPRAELATRIARLAEAGIAPSAIEASGEDDRVRLLPISERPVGHGAATHRLITAAASTCAALAVVAVILPFILQQLEIRRQQRQIATLQPGVSEVMTLRQRVAGQAAGADVVAAERAKVGDALGALAAVTETMPDNTFLTALGISKRMMSMTGQSADAANLISALSANPAIRNPSFSAPVTTAPNGQGSLFSISAELTP